MTRQHVPVPAHDYNNLMWAVTHIFRLGVHFYLKTPVKFRQVASRLISLWQKSVHTQTYKHLATALKTASEVSPGHHFTVKSFEKRGVFSSWSPGSTSFREVNEIFRHLWNIKKRKCSRSRKAKLSISWLINTPVITCAHELCVVTERMRPQIQDKGLKLFSCAGWLGLASEIVRGAQKSE